MTTNHKDISDELAYLNSYLPQTTRSFSFLKQRNDLCNEYIKEEENFSTNFKVLCF